MRLLDKLAAYSFNLYYVKGRDMIMVDYLSRHRTKDSDTSELIPISFCPLTSYYKCLEENAYCIGTRASAKAAGEIAPKVHGADKPLNPNLKPEHQGRDTKMTGSQTRFLFGWFKMQTPHQHHNQPTHLSHPQSWVVIATEMHQVPYHVERFWCLHLYNLPPLVI